MKQKDFEFIGIKLVQEKGNSEVLFRERLKIINNEGEEEERWFPNSIKPPIFPHDDLKKAIRDLLTIFAKQTGRGESFERTKDPVATGIRISYFGVEKKKENTIYVIKGLVREPSGYYNSYVPKKLNEKLREYYDENDELPILADVIVKEAYEWVTAHKYDNSGIQKLWQVEDNEMQNSGITIIDRPEKSEDEEEPNEDYDPDLGEGGDDEPDGSDSGKDVE